MKRDKSIRINWNASEELVINELIRELSLGSVHDLLRFLIMEKMQAVKKDKLRYGGRLPNSGPREKQRSLDDKIGDLKKMTDADLTDYLEEIGYILPEEPMADIPDVVLRSSIQTDAAGNRFFCEEHYNLTQKKSNSFRQVFTFDELVKDLINNKRI